MRSVSRLTEMKSRKLPYRPTTPPTPSPKKPNYTFTKLHTVTLFVQKTNTLHNSSCTKTDTLHNSSCTKTDILHNSSCTKTDTLHNTFCDPRDTTRQQLVLFLDILLKGTNKIDLDTRIFRYVQDFIGNTNRFL